MTNFERIKKMTVEECIEEFNSIKEFPFQEVFDFRAYLNGENPDIMEYIRQPQLKKYMEKEIQKRASAFASAREQRLRDFCDSIQYEDSGLSVLSVFEEQESLLKKGHTKGRDRND